MWGILMYGLLYNHNILSGVNYCVRIVVAVSDCNRADNVIRSVNLLLANKHMAWEPEVLLPMVPTNCQYYL